MKKILCFGDSNTYGFIPENWERYDENTRWTGILKNKLSGFCEVIEAGCNNRNGFIDTPEGDEFTGYKILPKYLKENPDIVIVALGINDLQKFYKTTPEQIEQGLKSMLMSIDTHKIVLTPPVLDSDVLNGKFSFQFDEQSVEKSKLLPNIYRKVVRETNSKIIDLNNYVKPSHVDGLHYSAESHNIIGCIIYEFIRTNF